MEYRERQHDEPVAFFDKPERTTVSGVHRGEQRALYDARREAEIPRHGLRLAVVRPADLDADARGRLRRRDRTADLAAVAARLAPVLETWPSWSSDEDRVVHAFRTHLTGDGWRIVAPTDRTPTSRPSAMAGGWSPRPRGGPASRASTPTSPTGSCFDA